MRGNGFPLPQGVREAIRRRLAPLPAGCREILTVASVIGREFDLVCLRRACAVETEHLDVVAPLVALGAPITVLTAATPRAVRGRLVSLLHSGVLGLLTQPLIAMAIFIVVQATTLTSAFFNAAIESDLLHLLEHALYLGAGFLFWWPILAVDPTPRKEPLKIRCVALVVAVPLEVLFAVAILWAGRPLYPHYASLPRPWGGHAALLSQRKAGALLLMVPAVALGIPSLLFASALRRSSVGDQ